MRMTAPRRQAIRRLAKLLGELLPATSYRGTCFERIAAEMGLQRYWPESGPKTARWGGERRKRGE